MAAGCAATYMDFVAASSCGGDSLQESPFGEGTSRPFSVEFHGLGVDAGNDSSGPLSLSGLPRQLRFTSAANLALEVQDLQPLGRGGYGMVLAGNWRQEGRVAVKVLLSDEERWMESCYKEAVLSKLLAHPNVLQTYDFQAAVLTEADCVRARASWERQQQMLQQQMLQQQMQGQGVLAPGLHGAAAPRPDARADSFELLPLPSAGCGPVDALGTARGGGCSGATDLWQVLFMLGARPGQFVTLIVMEYAEVGTLQRAVVSGAFRENGRLSKWAALRSLLVTAKEIAGGMCLLHSYKIIHGDLSATNVMLRCSRIDKRGFVAKVADFGLSKVTTAGVARTDDWAGQAQYMAPEVLDHEARLASDVYAFGVLLFEMAAGRKAFAEYQPAQILAGRLAGDLLLEWPPDAPPQLRALAERCMQREPEARPSFREVVEELRRQDAEAKAQHRQHALRRRATAEGVSAAAAMLAGALGPGSGIGGVSGMPPLRPHRLAAASPSVSTPFSSSTPPPPFDAVTPPGPPSLSCSPCNLGIAPTEGSSVFSAHHLPLVFNLPVAMGLGMGIQLPTQAHLPLQTAMPMPQLPMHLPMHTHTHNSSDSAQLLSALASGGLTGGANILTGGANILTGGGMYPVAGSAVAVSAAATASMTLLGYPGSSSDGVGLRSCGVGAVTAAASTSTETRAAFLAPDLPLLYSVMPLFPRTASGQQARQLEPIASGEQLLGAGCDRPSSP
ncbi:hypothetical protein GPECTOR_5g380 [Gonium pectorale]|uniref:Protein kinase domain-containing protein n=1 Tax=Gonium pectorale TaxID=33097 RepID=A0A150GWW1_GONPE|nr:hypothetical protein GPECTOR_5g380 [Gonium pectorale]|eukprot:KXZ54294.1 hypothetical protein GPECTOR_5g380 [Gonium pectorale]